ncbi:MAG: heme ABC exporter ATP-binding protein CcmA [Rhodobacteraceae bacterium]|nr:MAG: heme ABC exporter ATP-binding protein CcmA [Paracoccaceae bacterium]
MLLSVSDVSVSRGGRVLLEGVTFDLQAGRAIVLTGQNGIGKTSLLRTLAGLQDANSGCVDVPQNGVVYSAHLDGIKHALSVAENLQFWGAVFGRSNVDAALETFELYHLRDVMAGALSAGQKRRLGLARLLVTGRSIWLLDEPTASLDLGSIKQLTRVLNEHLGAGGSTIIATHSALDLKGQEVTIDLGKFAATKTGLSASEEAFL